MKWGQGISCPSGMGVCGDSFGMRGRIPGYGEFRVFQTMPVPPGTAPSIESRHSAFSRISSEQNRNRNNAGAIGR